LLLEAGSLSDGEAYHAFNMGLGMLVIVPAYAVASACIALPEANIVGEVIAGAGVVLR